MRTRTRISCVFAHGMNCLWIPKRTFPNRQLGCASRESLSSDGPRKASCPWKQGARRGNSHDPLFGAVAVSVEAGLGGMNRRKDSFGGDSDFLPNQCSACSFFSFLVASRSEHLRPEAVRVPLRPPQARNSLTGAGSAPSSALCASRAWATATCAAPPSCTTCCRHVPWQLLRMFFNFNF